METLQNLNDSMENQLQSVIDDIHNTSHKIPNNRINQTSNETTGCNINMYDRGDIHHAILIGGSSAIILLGTIGNVATYCVFRRRIYRNNIIASMFRYQSMLDLLFIWTIVLAVFLKGSWGYDFPNLSIHSCFMFVTWDYCILSLTNWLLVVITLTRYIHLKYPLRIHTICSDFNYKLSLLACVLVSFGTHVSSMLMAYLRYRKFGYEKFNICFLELKRPGVVMAVDRIMRLIVDFAAPSVILCLNNVMIIFELKSLGRRQTRLFTDIPTATKSLTKDQSTNALKPCIPDNCEPMHHIGLESVSEQVYHETDYWKSLSKIDRPYCNNATLLIKPRTDNPQNKDISNAINRQRICDNSTKAGFLEHDLSLNNKEFLAVPKHRHIAPSGSRTDADTSFQFPGVGPSRPSKESYPSQGGSSNVSKKQYMQPIREWISDQRTHGVNMEFDDNHNIGIKFNFSDSSKTQEKGWLEKRESKLYTIDELTPRKSFVRSHQKGDVRIRLLTKMLITASAINLSLNLPFWIYKLAGYNWLSKFNCPLAFILFDVALLLRYANNSVNFLMYCVIGSHFRQEVIAWLRRPYFKL